MKSRLLILALIAAVCLSQVCWANTSTRDMKWDVLKIYLDPYPQSAGPIQLKLDVLIDCDCEQLEVEIDEVDNLQINTPDFSTYSVIPHDTFCLVLDLTIPPNDTSGLYFFIGGCDDRIFGGTYFVTRPDTVILFEGSSPRDFLATRLIEERRVRDSLVRQRTSHPRIRTDNRSPEPYSGRTTQVGFFDEDGTFYDRDSLPPDFAPPHLRTEDNEPEDPMDSLKQVRLALLRKTKEDTTLTIASRRDGTMILIPKSEREDTLRVWKERRQLSEMLELEKTPLLDADFQTHCVGDRTYARSKGETAFQLRASRSDSSAHILTRIARYYSGRLAYILDLRDPDDLAFVEAHVEFLGTASEAGYYWTMLNDSMIELLRQRGISWKIKPRPRSTDR